MGSGLSKTYAYCPGGYMWNTQSINGTLFLICAPIAPGQQKMNNDEISLVLGLCLGIPLCIFTLYLIHLFLPKCKWQRKSVENKVYHDPLVNSISELSPSALLDIRIGNLSQSLKEEFMLLRIKKGRDLTEVLKYAEQCEQAEIADWIHKMNPCDFPQWIREKGAAHQIIQVNLPPPSFPSGSLG